MIIMVSNEQEVAVSGEAWTVAEAKARFSEIIDKAAIEGPQTVTRRGRKIVVIVDAEEWERKTRRSGSLAAFLATSPLRDSGLEIERSKEALRDVKL
jgi:prevent-host-death family protein